jgi:DNA-binding winged helix-turn-helix (wHTH) protein
MCWAFGEFELDCAEFELFRSGERVRLQRKPLQLLMYLVRNAARTVPSGELVREIWPDVIVTEASVRRAIKGLRAALGGPKDELIESRRGYGYRFVGELSILPSGTLPFGGTGRLCSVGGDRCDRRTLQERNDH